MVCLKAVFLSTSALCRVLISRILKNCERGCYIYNEWHVSWWELMLGDFVLLRFHFDLTMWPMSTLWHIAEVWVKSIYMTTQLLYLILHRKVTVHDLQVRSLAALFLHTTFCLLFVVVISINWLSHPFFDHYHQTDLFIYLFIHSFIHLFIHSFCIDPMALSLSRARAHTHMHHTRTTHAHTLCFIIYLKCK
jgi:hypothetical protein